MEQPLPEISAQDAIVQVADGALLIDVREQYEWDGGHAPDAVLIPLSEIRERLHEIPSDAPVLVVCHSGMRSAQVTDFLLSQGRDAVNVSGGMMAWYSAGGEIGND